MVLQQELEEGACPGAGRDQEDTKRTSCDRAVHGSY